MGIERNPENPLLVSLREQWMKIAALLVYRSGQTHAEISAEDIEGMSKMFNGELPTIVVEEKRGRIMLDLVPLSEGERRQKAFEQSHHRN